MLVERVPAPSDRERQASTRSLPTHAIPTHVGDSHDILTDIGRRPQLKLTAVEVTTGIVQVRIAEAVLDMQGVSRAGRVVESGVGRLRIPRRSRGSLAVVVIVSLGVDDSSVVPEKRHGAVRYSQTPSYHDGALGRVLSAHVDDVVRVVRFYPRPCCKFSLGLYGAARPACRVRKNECTTKCTSEQEVSLHAAVLVSAKNAENVTLLQPSFLGYGVTDAWRAHQVILSSTTAWRFIVEHLCRVKNASLHGRNRQ